MFWRRAGIQAHNEFIQVVQLLDLEVEQLNVKIAALNGCSLELLDRRYSDIKSINFDPKKTNSGC